MRRLIGIIQMIFHPKTEKKNKKTLPAATRKKPAPKWVQPTIKSTVIITATILVVGGPFWLLQSEYFTRSISALQLETVEQSARLGFRVDKIFLRGRVNTPRASIIKVVGLKRGDPILGFEVENLQKKLINLPWVKSATVKRNWPNLVEIRISERYPIALWQRNKYQYLIDTGGKIITPNLPNGFPNLLIVAGKGAPKAAPKLIGMIKSEPPLAAKVSIANLIGQRRWNLKLKTGIEIRLPAKNPLKAWKRLSYLNSKHKVLTRDIQIIDMRLPSRLIIRPGVLGRQITRFKGQKT